MNSIGFFGQVAYYNEQYDAASSAEEVAYAKAVLFVLTFFIACILLAYVILGMLLSKIFKKAGVSSWKAWVPVYNNWTLLELGGQKGWWAVLAFVPVINIASLVFIIIAMYHIGRNFGKDDSFVLFAIFIPLVWFFLLATDNSKWKKASTIHYAKKLPPLK